MSRMIELIETITGDVATVPVEGVEAQLRQWIEPDPYAVEGEGAVAELAAALLAGDDAEARKLADELAIGFYEVATKNEAPLKP